MASALTSPCCGQLGLRRAIQSLRQLEVVSTKRNTRMTVHSAVSRKEGMVIVPELFSPIALISHHKQFLKHGVEKFTSIINDARIHENLNVRGAGVCSDSQGERGRHHSAWLLENDRGSFEKIFSEDAIISMLKEVVSQCLALFSKCNRHLKHGVEEVMSIINNAGVHGQRPPRAYDVFISYKQDDTLHPVSHLKDALDLREIKTFVDFALEGGVDLRLAFDKAIERSEIALVVVSQNFHSSPWCLNELVKILECQKKWGLIVLPIFWGVNAKELREQPRHFVQNIGQGEKGFEQDNPHLFQKWRGALRTLGFIKGWSFSTRC